MTVNVARQPDGTLAYIEMMLAELRKMSAQENCKMLTYLIEMALVEASDLKTEMATQRENDWNIGEIKREQAQNRY